MPAQTFHEYLPEPIEFTLNGVTVDGGPWTITYHCLPVAPAWVTDEWARFTEGSVPSLFRCFRAVIHPQERSDFEDLIAEGSARLVSYTQLGEAMKWLLGVYNDRPTNGQPTSLRSLPNTGPTSGAGSSSADTLRLPSLDSVPPTSSTPRSQ